SAQTLPTAPAAAGSLDGDDVAAPQLSRHLPGQGLAVQEVSPGRTARSAALARRPVPSPLADDRDATVFEDPELADDAVAAAVPPCTARAESQPVALDAKRVLELERLHRRRQRVRHRDVHAARTVRARARA